MGIVILTIVVFLWLIQWIVILDIILSWLVLFWIKFRPKFIAQIIDPLYNNIRKIIPTNLGPFDFTPIVIFIAIEFINNFLLALSPQAQEIIKYIIN